MKLHQEDQQRLEKASQFLLHGDKYNVLLSTIYTINYERSLKMKQLKAVSDFQHYEAT